MASTLQISSEISAHRLASSHRLEPPRSVRCRNRTFPGLKITAFVSSLLAHRQCSLGALRQRNVALDCETCRGDRQLRYGQKPIWRVPLGFPTRKKWEKEGTICSGANATGRKAGFITEPALHSGNCLGFPTCHTLLHPSRDGRLRFDFNAADVEYVTRSLRRPEPRLETRRHEPTVRLSE